jgi:hypothetical protein
MRRVVVDMAGGSTRFGIPINLALAFGVGAAFSVRSSDGNAFESDLPVIGIAIGMFIQEMVLVQILSRDANTGYEDRLLGNEVTPSRRRQFLFAPFFFCLVLGLVIAWVSPRPLDFIALVRVISVSVILTLCMDPLMGLHDKGPTALVGAGMAYVLVLQAGISGYPNIAEWLSQWMPYSASALLSTGVLTYLILSCRWTYYRLFCFEEMEDWHRAAIDTFIPFIALFAGALPNMYSFFALLFTGITN